MVGIQSYFCQPVGYRLLYLGFVMSLEVGWMDAIWDGFTLKTDISVGIIVMICGAFLYRSGFKSVDTKVSK